MVAKIAERKLKKLPYPMTMDYVPEWGEWEIIRELTSNAKDTGADYKVYREDNNLIIEDNGNGLKIRQLLFGVSEKEGVDNAIGQFGEGLKLAMLVLTRMGNVCEVFSGDLYITNDSEMLEDADREIFVLKYCKTEEIFAGTKVVIHDWESGDYQEQFIHSDDEKIIVQIKNSKNSILTSGSGLFVKGVFTQDLPYHEFGYDVEDANMNRDRSTVGDYEINARIANIWMKMDDPLGWESFFEAVENGKKEKDISLSAWKLTEEVKFAIAKGFHNTFGENAVLETDKTSAKEAEHRGAKIISLEMFGYNMQEIMKNIVHTDKSFVVEKRGRKAFVVEYKDLDEFQKETWKAVKRVCRKYGFDTDKVYPASLPSDVGGEAYNGTIKINVSQLYSKEKAISILIHEMAHILYFTQDLTDAHVDACTDIGAQLIMKLMNITE